MQVETLLREYFMITCFMLCLTKVPTKVSLLMVGNYSVVSFNSHLYLYSLSSHISHTCHAKFTINRLRTRLISSCLTLVLHNELFVNMGHCQMSHIHTNI